MKLRHILIAAMILLIAAPVLAKGNRHGYGIKGKLQYHHNQHPAWRCSLNDARDDGRYGYGHNKGPGRHLLRDADGDGIPNGRDPDFTPGFSDANGDGVCDHRQNSPSTAGGSS